MGDLDANKQVLELNVEKQLWEKEERGSSGDVGKDNMPGMCEPPVRFVCWSLRF